MASYIKGSLTEKLYNTSLSVESGLHKQMGNSHLNKDLKARDLLVLRTENAVDMRFKSEEKCNDMKYRFYKHGEHSGVSLTNTDVTE